MRWPVFAVLVQGPSMVPALRHGDALLVRRGGPVRPGDVVVGRFRSRPDLLVLKRAVRPDDGGWWLEGDNALVADDSRRYGPADVVGRVLLRYWPRPLWPVRTSPAARGMPGSSPARRLGSRRRGAAP